MGVVFRRLSSNKYEVQTASYQYLHEQAARLLQYPVQKIELEREYSTELPTNHQRKPYSRDLKACPWQTNKTTRIRTMKQARYECAGVRAKIIENILDRSKRVKNEHFTGLASAVRIPRATRILQARPSHARFNQPGFQWPDISLIISLRTRTAITERKETAECSGTARSAIWSRRPKTNGLSRSIAGNSTSTPRAAVTVGCKTLSAARHPSLLTSDQAPGARVVQLHLHLIWDQDTRQCVGLHVQNLSAELPSLPSSSLLLKRNYGINLHESIPFHPRRSGGIDAAPMKKLRRSTRTSFVESLAQITQSRSQTDDGGTSERAPRGGRSNRLSSYILDQLARDMNRTRVSMLQE